MTNIGVGLMDIQEASAFIGMSVSFIYKLTRTGSIPHIKVGRILKFRPTDLESWLNSLTRGRS